MTIADDAVIAGAARQVEALQGFPRLVSLIDETASQSPASRATWTCEPGGSGRSSLVLACRRRDRLRRR